MHVSPVVFKAEDFRSIRPLFWESCWIVQSTISSMIAEFEELVSLARFWLDGSIWWTEKEIESRYAAEKIDQMRAHLEHGGMRHARVPR